MQQWMHDDGLEITEHPALDVRCLLYTSYAFATGLITYNSSRIDIWLDPFNEEWMRDKGYQIRQSLLSIGSGGLFGLGLGKSRQKFLFLPEEHNLSLIHI